MLNSHELYLLSQKSDAASLSSFEWSLYRVRQLGYYRPQGKVMFSKACVSHSVHRALPSGQGPPDRDPLDRDPWTETTPCTGTPWMETPWTETLHTEATLCTEDRDPPDGEPHSSHCGSRYASYWNAFLFIVILVTHKQFKGGYA